MKISLLILSGISAETSPTEHLASLVDTAVNFIESDAFDGRTRGRRGQEFRNRWTARFQNNSRRLSNTFRRCGIYDGDFATISIEEDDSCSTMSNILDGFQAWTDAYLIDCKSRPHVHQGHRITRWRRNLVEQVLKCNLEATTTTTTTEAPEPRCLDIDDSPDEPFYYHKLMTDYSTGSWDLTVDTNFVVDYSTYAKDSLVKISKVCNPDWRVTSYNPWSWVNCETAASRNFCQNMNSESYYTRYHMPSDTGLQSWLNCPQCGCVDDNAEKWCVASGWTKSRSSSNLEDENLLEIGQLPF